MVEVVEAGEDELDLERLAATAPTREQAAAFGARLAATHAAGARAYGSPPEGWRGDGWLGPLSEPLPLALDPRPTWGEFYATQRLEPMLRAGVRLGVYDAAATAVFERVAARVATGELDTDEPASRLHGDLWAGNIVWTEREACSSTPPPTAGTGRPTSRSSCCSGRRTSTPCSGRTPTGTPSPTAGASASRCTSCTR